MRPTALSLLLAASLIAAPVAAGNKLIPSGARQPVGKSAMTVQPDREWNRLSARPGRNSESWTIDGDLLNDLTFYGGIDTGKTLFRQVDKRNRPLPLFSSTMLLTDIPALFENSYRIAIGTSLMTIDTTTPAEFLGGKGIAFTYSFVRQGEDVRRRGEAKATIRGGKLYMITYEAPVLHFFDASAPAARTIIDSAKL